MKFSKHLWLVPVLLPSIILSACNLGATPPPAEDPGVIQTQAFNDVLTQVASQQTQTAQSAPPTPLSTNTFLPTATLGAIPTFAPANGVATITPFLFNTQQPGFTPITSPVVTPGGVSTITTKNGCNDGMYMGEYPHYTDANNYLEVNIGEVVEQFFTYKNTGTCAWDEGYGFMFQSQISSPEIEGNNIVLPRNKPSDYTIPGNQISYKGIIKAPKVAGDYVAFWKLRDDGANLFGPLVSLYIRVKKP